jgi:hypothetical protein
VVYKIQSPEGRRPMPRHARRIISIAFLAVTLAGCGSGPVASDPEDVPRETSRHEALLISVIEAGTILVEDLARFFAGTSRVLAGNSALIRAHREPISYHHCYNCDTDRR